MENEYSFKQFNDVIIKAINPIIIGNTTFEQDEVIFRFDKIEIGSLNENKTFKTAHGGFSDINLIYWENQNKVNIYFRQGVFNSQQLAFLTNSKLTNITNSNIIIHKREENEIINNKFTLLEIPQKIFVYNKTTGEKYTIQNIEEKQVFVTAPDYTDVVCEYDYNYVDGGQLIEFGNQLFNGFVALEGKTVIKDDAGELKTGIIQIPKLKLLSKLSLNLGAKAIPVSSEFNGEALPVGNRGQEKSINFYILNNYIEED